MNIIEFLEFLKSDFIYRTYGRFIKWYSKQMLQKFNITTNISPASNSRIIWKNKKKGKLKTKNSPIVTFN
jgi:hypothetical protein